MAIFSCKTDGELSGILEHFNRYQGIVVASWCFDIFHVGHLRHLEAASRLGQYLIVLVSDDQHVRLIKGKARPIIPEAQRAEIVNAIYIVKDVIIHSEITLNSIVSGLHSIKFVKGTDYEPIPLIT